MLRKIGGALLFGLGGFLIGNMWFQPVTGGLPRAADGHPDLSGVWQVLNSAHFDIEPHSARAAMAMRPGPVIPVPAKEVLKLGAVGSVPGSPGVVDGGKIPYREEALKIRDENRANYLDRDPEIKCFLPGVPRATYMPYPFQIFQGDKQILFAYEYSGAARNIFLKDPGPPPDDSWMGQSVGHWEGDTLVVDVTGLNDQTWLDRSGNFHSNKLHVIERYTMTAPNVIQYQATLEDPEIYTRPWTMSMTLYRRLGADAQLMQFKCVEFVEELRFGHLRKKPLK